MNDAMTATGCQIVKIPASEFLKFKIQFYQNRPNLRLGQAFLNRYFPDVADSQLYYSDNMKLIETIIWQHYIQPIQKGD
jgi:hypothetical protein